MTEAAEHNQSDRWDGEERRATPSFPRKSNQKLNKTITSTRETLISEGGYSREFDYEMLLAHARNYRAAMLVLVGSILLMGFISLNWLNYSGVIIWMNANLAVQILYWQQTHSYVKQKSRDAKELEKWSRTFTCLSLLSGITWACFLIIPVETPSLSQPVFSFTTLLIIIAVYCFINAPLSTGMFASTVPVTIMFVTTMGLSGYTSLVMMTTLFAGAQLMFILMGCMIKNNLVTMLTVRAEKENLIVDLEEATAISDDARRRSEEANLAKSRFLATMSHELRTPLNAILGFSEIMKQELLGPLKNDSYKEYIQDIHSSGEHLLSLINEILDLSRIEAGRYELNEEPVLLCDVVEDCHGLMEIRAKSKQIDIKVNCEPFMLKLWADEKAIRQIVLNLLSNAVKFTPQGGQIVVSVGWTAGSGQYVSVQDNGPGIPEEEIPIVLSQFGQGSSSIKSAEQGTGLGLPICQALVNMHGGAFNLKSKLRVGTNVTVTFPRVRVMSALAAKNTQSQDVLKPAGQRILSKRSA